jgi:microcin C transport system ATP-binding protein
MVMKDGEIIESGPVQSVLDAPQHPYTKILVAQG